MQYPALWLLLAGLLAVLLLLRNRQRKNRRLFQQRQDQILFVAELLDNYRKHAPSLERSRGLTFDMGTLGDFACLTEPECMEQIRSVLTDPYCEEKNAAFEQKMEEIEQRCGELESLFPSRLAAPMIRFLHGYRNLLESLRNYQMFIRRKNQDYSRICAKPMTREERILYFREGEPRMEVLRNFFDLREAVYLLMSKSTLYMVQRKFRLPKSED